jgi:hypothetical protein
MPLTIAGIAILTGIALSLRCHVFILLATIGGSIIGAGVVGIVQGREIGSAAVIVVIALQIGYVIGILARSVKRGRRCILPKTLPSQPVLQIAGAVVELGGRRAFVRRREMR